MRVSARPAFSIPVSEEEKVLARKVRKGFEELLQSQDRLTKFLSIFFDQLEKLEEKTGLVTISPVIKRYEHKMKKIFNQYIQDFSKALTTYENNFSDTEMDEIRDLLIENIRGMREEFIELVLLMRDVGAEDFVQESLQHYSSIIDTAEKIENIIKNEWFGHIDYDILGKIRLGQISVPLTTKRR